MTVAQTPTHDAGSDTAALGRLLDGRWSCRGFTDEPVPRPVIEQVLDLARRSASWCNVQPWHAHITEGEGTERFRAGLLASARAAGLEMTPDIPFPAQYTGVFQERRRECGMQLYASVGVARGDRAASAVQAARNFELFGAPHAAVVTTEADLGTYGTIDCGLYIQAFLLAAQSLGLGTIPQAALAGHAPFIREFFGLPEHRLVVCGISFGWPDLDHPANGFRTRRAGVEETVTWVD